MAQGKARECARSQNRGYKVKRMTVHALNIRRVSGPLMRQLRVEAESSGVTLRWWMLENLCKLCGLSPEGEERTKPGRKTKRQRREEEEQEARRLEGMRQWEQRKTCGAPGHRDGTVLICRLPRDHAGECSPDPTPSPPSDPA